MVCAVQLVLLLQVVLLVSGEQIEISLNGDSWKISDSKGKVKDLQATVPGNVHLDLLQHGVIEDPYFGWNDELLKWIVYDNWTYTLDKNLSSDDINGKTVWLKCDGLDTAATVSVNGRFIGTANNMYRRYFFDITEIVKVGQNMFAIMFESAANYSVKQEDKYPYPMKCGSYFNGTSARNFIRKPQSDFGWDWGPAFLPVGIWQNISIVTFEDAYVSYVTPKTDYDVNTKSYYLTVTVCVFLPTAQELTISVKTTSTDFDQATVDGSLKVSKSGETCQTVASKPIDASVAEKYFWWPRGVKWPLDSNKPTLIKTTTDIAVMKKSSQVTTAVQVMKNVGFRYIEIVQDPVGEHGKDGLTFYFQMTTPTINYPIYVKGSNFIPMDAFTSRATPDVARKILEAAVNGNQNMIRICGVGYYQPDWFYDMCDEMGIMVWQEFMFSDALCPRDKDFLENVEAEVRHVVRRLGYHPSIVLWCGNNENQAIPGRKDNPLAAVIDYSIINDQTVRGTLWEEDNTRPYWPSGPSNGYLVDDREKNLFIQRWGDPQDPSYGDIHRYDYYSYCTDVTKFPKPRFASEFGFQSYPSFYSMSQISGPKDWSNTSPLMLHRQHHPDGNAQLEAQMAMFFHLPNNTDRETQFRDFIYLTQVVQGICIKAQAEHYRRMISEEGILTRGTIYWQINDIWQTQSWASVEYSGQWKILHHYMKRAYEPVLLSSYQVNGSAVVYVVVDVINYSINYDLTVEVVAWKTGNTISTFKKQGLKSEGFTGFQVWTEKMDTIFKGSSTTEGFLYMTITETAGEILAESWLFPSNFTKVDLPAAKITTSGFKLSQDKKVVTFSLSSTAVAPYVYLTIDESYGVFSDNGLLVIPNKQYDVTYTSWNALNLQKFQSGLDIRSIRDTYGDVPYGH